MDRNLESLNTQDVICIYQGLKLLKEKLNNNHETTSYEKNMVNRAIDKIQAVDIMTLPTPEDQRELIMTVGSIENPFQHLV